MSGVGEFLLARVAEDEARALDFEVVIAKGIDGQYGSGGKAQSDPMWWGVEAIGFLPARVLAQCAAFRAIVAALSETATDPTEYSGWVRLAMDPLRILAAIWSDHPDFDPAWAVEASA